MKPEVFKNNWRYDNKTREGYFAMEIDLPVYGNYPECKGNYRGSINGDLAIGRAIIGLYELTGNEEYRIKAEALATKFRNNLILYNNKYLWQ